MMWPGSSTKFHGHKSKYIQKFSRSMDWTKKVNIMISWFLNPFEPANCVIAYFDEPDATAHIHGPFSSEVKSQLKRIDKTVNYLVHILTKSGIYEEVNIIFVSDHGMVDVPSNHIITLNKYVPSDWYEMYGSSPNWNIFPKPGRFSQTFEALKNATKVEPFKVYKKKEVPHNYHYCKNRRIGPLVVVADEGWELFQSTEAAKSTRNKTLGEHGYNNSLPSMRPLFVAIGPRFKSNYYFDKEFENIDLFPLMCYILQLLPTTMFPSNGSFDRISEILVPFSEIKYSTSLDKWASGKLYLLPKAICYHFLPLPFITLHHCSSIHNHNYSSLTFFLFGHRLWFFSNNFVFLNLI